MGISLIVGLCDGVGPSIGPMPERFGVTWCFAGVWQLPLTKFNVGFCTKLDVNATMGMIVQSFPGLTELGLAGLEMEARPEGVISKLVA